MQLSTEYVGINELTPHPENPRQGNVDAIAESLEVNGQYRPIVANHDTVILAGNHTWMAAQKLGWQTIWCSFINVSWEKGRQILLADNRHNDLAGYDEEALLKILQEVELYGTGFDDDYLNALLDKFSDEEDSGEEDAVEDDAPAISSVGDYWQLGNHLLICGDAKDETILRALGKIDCILTDPPYGINLDTDYSQLPKGYWGEQNKYKKVEGDSEPFDAGFWRQFFSGVKEQFWFGADCYRRTLTDSDLDGVYIVWDKRSHSQGASDDGLGSNFELIWSAQHHQKRILRHYWFGYFGEDSEAANRMHPTQKPTALLADILLRWTNREDVVADFFAGSGSTLIACEKTGRNFVGTEIDPHYIDVICKRFQQFTGIKPMRSGEAYDFGV